MYSIAVTGHRPDRLKWGYDYNSPVWVRLKNKFMEIVSKTAHEQYNKTGDGRIEMITGMALGVDMVFAYAAFELIGMGYQINLVAAAPFERPNPKWPESSKQLYNNILSRASETVVIGRGMYHPEIMHTRNRYMADRCDMLIAVWDGAPYGGTYKCIEYAENIKPITMINPSEISMAVIN